MRSIAALRKKIVLTLCAAVVVSGSLLFRAYGDLLDIMPKQDASGRLKGNGYGLLLLNPDQLSVSSSGSPTMGKEALVDGNPDTYWHVTNPKTTADDWLQVKLPEPLEIGGHQGALPQGHEPALVRYQLATIKGK